MSRWLICWLMLGTACCVAADRNATQTASPHSFQVECHGKLRSGMVHPGGETTGTTISFDRVIWELNLPDEASKKFAKNHHKELVFIKGNLRRVTGVERPVRWIVDVTQIQDPPADAKSNCATTTVCGKLIKQNGNLLISCNEITLPVEVTQDATLKSKADSLATKTVLMKGSIERVEGSELPVKVKIDAKTIELVPVTAKR